MPFTIVWPSEVQKQLRKLEKPVARQIVEKVETANRENRLFLEKVQGTPYFKFRVGKYRIFFTKEKENIALVNSVYSRDEAYEKIRRAQNSKPSR